MSLLKKGALALACCIGLAMGSAQAAKQELDVFYFTLDDMFMTQMSIEMQNTAIAKRIKLKQHDALTSAELQIEQVKKVLAQPGYNKPILVNVVDTDTAFVLLEEAKKVDVPIIFFNRVPNMGNFQSYDKAWYIGSDPEEAGTIQAEIVIEYLKKHPEADSGKDGFINYIIFQGSPTHYDTAMRTNSFVNTMRDSGFKLKVIYSVYADWEAAKAHTKMSNILDNVEPQNIDLIVSNNDAMAIGAIRALYKYGYNIPKVLNPKHGKEMPNPKSMRANMPKIPYIPVVGIDALPDAIDAVERGTMLGSVYNDGSATANVVMRIANAYLNNIKITESHLGYPVDTRIIEIPYIKVFKEE